MESVDIGLFECLSENKSKKRVKSDVNNNEKRNKINIDDDISMLSEIDDVKMITLKEVPCELTCLHKVAVKNNENYDIPTQFMGSYAKKYDFNLDAFQKQAITCIERNESVLVSAHTSSGKTVVAEYAIAKSLNNSQRVIYTSPIKALSNQKYRELNEYFNDVGLQTGDVTLNPEGSCVVMTTEILRSMLYKGSEIIREVAWVIFDEIHYMRDEERGVVWEESLIMLPDNVRYVFLSATIPNACEFASWICFLHNQPCHVITTDFRPTPLQHYMLPNSGDCLYLIMDEKNMLKEDKLKEVIKASSNNESYKKSSSTSKNIVKLSKSIVERGLTPVILFSFSKKECEHYAVSLSEMDFTNNEEKHMIEEIFKNAIDGLAIHDKNLPQIMMSLPLLKNGIGIHHSGLLPILKEVTEILFSEGLLKFLFSTETFAMGLNMPARTVVFTSYTKYDGFSNRIISSGEYIQMSGRAGRRGIDERGLCILMIDSALSENMVKSMYNGVAEKLTSAFRLTYNMILNLLRIEGVNPEYMMSKSFFQFQTYIDIPEKINKYKQLKKEYEKLIMNNDAIDERIEKYIKLKNEYELIKDRYISLKSDIKAIRVFIQPGRIVKIESEKENYGYGCILSTLRSSVDNESNSSSKYYADVLLSCNVKMNDKLCEYSSSMDEIKPQIIPISVNLFSEITAIRITLPKENIDECMKLSIMKNIEKIKKKFLNTSDGGLPVLDPIKDMKIESSGFVELKEKFENLKEKYTKNKITHKLEKKSKKYIEKMDKYTHRKKLENDISKLELEIDNSKNIIKLSDLKSKKRLLRRLGFIHHDDSIDIKGRVACEISCADELVLTELLFNGFFNNLSSHYVCAILSCFIFQEKSNDTSGNNILSEDDVKIYNKLKETIVRIGQICRECIDNFSYDDYVNSFKSDLFNVFYKWSTGCDFLTIINSCSIFEGSIIRCLRRLDELLKQLVSASHIIGNADLDKLFQQCIQNIKRDVAFTSSLYI